jgi:hypothetical protein
MIASTDGAPRAGPVDAGALAPGDANLCELLRRIRSGLPWFDRRHLRCAPAVRLRSTKPRVRSRLRLLELEPDPHLDLEVRDLILLDVPADAPNFDPVEPAQRFRGSRNARPHRFGDAVGRGAGDFDDPVRI